MYNSQNCLLLVTTNILNACRPFLVPHLPCPHIQILQGALCRHFLSGASRGGEGRSRAWMELGSPSSQFQSGADSEAEALWTCMRPFMKLPHQWPCVEVPACIHMGLKGTPGPQGSPFRKMASIRHGIPVPYLVRPQAQLGTATLSACWRGLTWLGPQLHSSKQRSRAGGGGEGAQWATTSTLA